MIISEAINAYKERLDLFSMADREQGEERSKLILYSVDGKSNDVADDIIKGMGYLGLESNVHYTFIFNSTFPKSEEGSITGDNWKELSDRVVLEIPKNNLLELEHGVLMGHHPIKRYFETHEEKIQRRVNNLK